MQDFFEALKNPSRQYGEVPFYWWTGEQLNKSRLSEQLTKLAEAGVAGVQINYAHGVEGGENNLRYGGCGKTIPGQPDVFTEEWWDFFCHAARECERLGMGIGVGDYTLAWIGNGYKVDEIAEKEEFQAKELSCEKISYSKDYILPDNTLVLIGYEDADCEKPIELEQGQFFDGIGGVYLVTLKRKELSINPMHPECGKALVDIYFREFERRLPDLKAGTLNYFFQDELNFGCDVKKIWDENLRKGVLDKYGFDALLFIPHLFFNLGKITAKIRLNVNDVKTSLCEEGYFKPVYNFHASRGMIYGCDQSSRGRDPGEFTDYFRTVRWFTAPGNDTPGRAADMIKVKVNSSISHLYNRPRTWLEGYHSSGWGTTLDSITNPTGDNFIFGANLLNLHGLYYTTNAGFFEWAPPDFHFRMPYWDDEKYWLRKYNRLAQLLTTGVHRCDAAIYYPTPSVIAGIDGDKAVNETFSTAEHIFSRGLDFDFIDTDSLLRAEFNDGFIRVAGEKYKILIFSYNDTLCYPTVKAIKQFLDCGGCVVFVGIAPSVSDRAGASDPEFLSEIDDILSHPNCCIAANNDALMGFCDRKLQRIFRPDSFGSSRIYSMCRKSGKDRLYYVRYAEKDCVCTFEGSGNAYLFDITKGRILLLTGALCIDKNTIIRIPENFPEDIIILFTEKNLPFDGTVSLSLFGNNTDSREILLDGNWKFSVIPVLDNRWGDFYKPAGGTIGLQARFFDVAKVESDGEIPKKYAYTNLPYAHTMGVKRIEAPGLSSDLAAAISSLGEISTDVISFRDTQFRVEALKLHDRYGFIAADWDNNLWDEGYHGLKGKVHDDNFFFTKDSVFIAGVTVAEKTEAKLLFTGQKPDSLFIGGIPVTDADKPIIFEAGTTTVVASYTVNESKEIYRNRGKFKRAGIYFIKDKYAETDKYELAKSDFANSNYLHYGDGEIYCYRFRTAPGFAVMKCSVLGEVLSAYNDTKPMSVLPCDGGEFGTNSYEVRTGNISEGISEVLLYVKAWEGYGNTGVIPCPIDLHCGDGVMQTGDLADTNSALTCFSGKSVYEKNFTLDSKNENKKYILEIEDAGATVNVNINGIQADVLTSRPFRTEITEFVTAGENTLKLTVSNTLCNHYSTIPSRYSNFPQDAKSGLVGRVAIIIG